MKPLSIEIIGSGVAGLCCALLFAQRGCTVTVHSASQGFDQSCCSWWAGGMLAPWCEMATTGAIIGKLGHDGIKFWAQHHAGTVAKGSLVIASQRDLPDLHQFAARTEHFERCNASDIEQLEPDLAGRFTNGLFFPEERHVDPRAALGETVALLRTLPNVHLRFESALSLEQLTTPTTEDWRIDCRGLSARDQLPTLRGVRGEMLVLQTRDITLHRPVRLLHPRYPLYIVPRHDHQFMVGATMIESDYRGKPTVQSVMELLSAAYSLHPAFAEAQIVEMGADVRPAFPNNYPKIVQNGRTLFVNGLFRHGFLCGPALAQRAVDFVLDGHIDTEIWNEYTA